MQVIQLDIAAASHGRDNISYFRQLKDRRGPEMMQK
jgi:hypothetical protein